MGIIVVNSDFEKLWGEPYPEIAFDNATYSLAGEVGTTLSASFAIFDNKDVDVTDQCEITLDNDNVSIEDGMFVCDDLEVGTYQTIATATYSYLSATVTATATINISVQEQQPTSISFNSATYSMSGNEDETLTQAFSVSDDLSNDITSLCAYSFSPNDKGVYADGGYFKVDSAVAGTYNITVTATYGQLTNTATIAMSVVDYPDSISFDSNSYTMSGDEGDTITESFTVTDDLNNDLTSQCSYTLSPNDTGLTASNGTFDASSVTAGTYSVTVTATYASGNGSTLTATATISIEVQSASFANKYLTTEALGSGKITLSIPKDKAMSMTSISYSLDNGANWTTQNVGSGYGTTSLSTTNLTQGDIVLWKGTGIGIAGYSLDSDNSSRFSATCNFNASGNVMSLLYGDNFRNQTTLPGASYQSGNFANLFRGCTRLISAENMVLPATTLKQKCYQNMFNGCTALTTAPELPVTTLANYCYQSMFSGCTSLTTAPELPATTLEYYCYSSMFYGCTALTTAPVLPATTLAEWCYQSMFKGCTSLTTAPALSATTLKNYCYQSMFSGCTSLTTAPELPATTLAEGCYNSMFNGCTGLTTAPELPATTLASSCYSNMFSGTNSLPDCSNIDFTSSTVVASGGLRGLFAGTKVTYNDLMTILPLNANNKPYLPATTLAQSCYSSMFSGCTSLTTAPELPANTLANYCYSSMFYGCTALTTAPVLPATTLAEWCYQSMFKGCTSLTTAPALHGTTIPYKSCSGMFQNCTSLTTLPQNMLPATTVQGYGYGTEPGTSVGGMFEGCTSLTTAPELPATTFADKRGYQYAQMFKGCTSLTTAPELPATTLQGYSYNEMFSGCTQLNNIKMLATDISETNCLNNWVKNVAATGTFTKDASMTTLPTGDSGIPTNWTVVDA